MKTGVELIKELSLIPAPSGEEARVADAIEAELSGLSVSLTRDRLGNLIAHKQGQVGAPRVLVSAHMDEVGFIVTEITKEGYLRFANVGGIDPRVLCGRAVTLLGKEGDLSGVIIAKGIHLQNKEEREKMPAADDFSIDIGTDSREESEKLVEIGTEGTFDSDFTLLGANGEYVACKALDDRMGCAAMIEMLRELEGKELPVDLYMAFTVREEIGLTGAKTVAQNLSPDFSIVLETTAIADLPDVPAHRRVADVGSGGVLSLCDNGTVYDRAFVEFALALAGPEKIPAQVKRFVSGGNDAAKIQRTGVGVRCLALSLATRYLHAPCSVASLADYESVKALVLSLFAHWNEGGF